MIAYPGSEGEQRVASDALHRVVAGIFRACGMSADDADLLSDTLVVADLQGVHSHGVLRVPEYVDKLSTGGVDPRGRPRIVGDSVAAIVVDGANSMGQIGAAFAMRLAVERARTTSVAVAAVRGSNHCGAMAYFARLALPEDMIGLATTNALPTMAPWGTGGRTERGPVGDAASGAPHGAERTARPARASGRSQIAWRTGGALAGASVAARGEAAGEPSLRFRERAEPGLLAVAGPAGLRPASREYLRIQIRISSRACRKRNGGQAVGRTGPPRRRGSSTSRSASPSMLKP